MVASLFHLIRHEEEWVQTRPNQPYPQGIAELIVAKHRKGPTGSVMLEFIDNLVRFDPVQVTMV